MTELKLGCVGLGSMGAPMAMRLVNWPGGLVVFDVRDEAMLAFGEAGVAFGAAMLFWVVGAGVAAGAWTIRAFPGAGGR